MFLLSFSIFCPNVQSPPSFVFRPTSFVLIPFQDRRQRTEDRGWRTEDRGQRTKASDAHTNAPHLGEAALLPLLPARAPLQPTIGNWQHWKLATLAHWQHSPHPSHAVALDHMDILHHPYSGYYLKSPDT